MRLDQRQLDVEAALKQFGCTNLKVGKKAVPDTRHQLGVRKAAHRLFDVRGRNAQRAGNFDDRQRRFVGDDENVLLHQVAAHQRPRLVMQSGAAAAANIQTFGPVALFFVSVHHFQSFPQGFPAARQPREHRSPRQTQPVGDVLHPLAVQVMAHDDLAVLFRKERHRPPDRLRVRPVRLRAGLRHIGHQIDADRRQPVFAAQQVIMLMAQHAVQPCPTVGRRAVVLQRRQQRFLRKVLGVVPISADAQRGAEQLVRVSLQAVCVHPPCTSFAGVFVL